MGNDSKDTAGVDDTATSLKNLVIVAVASFGITQLISYLCDCGSVLLHATAAFTILLQLVVYGHASGVLFGNEMTERFYDLTGSLTFISAVLLSAHWCPRELTERQQALIKLVILWAVRLGLFLFTRIQGAGGHDSRFVKLKRNRYRFAIPWIIQGVWVFLTALPIFILNANAEETGAIALTALDYCGLAVWAIGFVIEVVADMQKYLWKRNTVNHNKFINTGLWRVSRHPNCKIYNKHLLLTFF